MELICAECGFTQTIKDTSFNSYYKEDYAISECILCPRNECRASRKTPVGYTDKWQYPLEWYFRIPNNKIIITIEEARAIQRARRLLTYGIAKMKEPEEK